MSMKLKPVWLSMALACAWWSTPSTAQEPVGDAVEVAASESVLTMRVDGEVVFDTQGKVIEHKVITPDLEEGVRRFASEQLAAMRFVRSAIFAPSAAAQASGEVGGTAS